MVKLTRLFLLVGAAQLLCTALTLGQGSYKTENISSAPADVPKTLQDALQPQGVRVLSEKGALCEIWFGKAVTQGAGGGDAVYPTLSVGEFVGVVHFPGPGADFRGQTIKSGYYTLRYALLPQDGNHMGVNPYRDFLLLGPAAADTQIDKNLKATEVYVLSRQASGTPHPAVWSLIPTSQGASFPSLVQDDQGHWVLQVKLPGSGGAQDLPLAIVVVGQASAT